MLADWNCISCKLSNCMPVLTTGHHNNLYTVCKVPKHAFLEMGSCSVSDAVALFWINEQTDLHLMMPLESSSLGNNKKKKKLSSVKSVVHCTKYDALVYWRVPPHKQCLTSALENRAFPWECLPALSFYWCVVITQRHSFTSWGFFLLIALRCIHL